MRCVGKAAALRRQELRSESGHEQQSARPPNSMKYCKNRAEKTQKSSFFYKSGMECIHNDTLHAHTVAEFTVTAACPLPPSSSSTSSLQHGKGGGGGKAAKVVVGAVWMDDAGRCDLLGLNLAE